MTVEQINSKNMETYEQFGHKTSNIARYICTQCKEHVSLDRSTSNKGNNLVCNKCVHSVFGSLAKTFDFAYEKTK